jgi:hypothetical protein
VNSAKSLVAETARLASRQQTQPLGRSDYPFGDLLWSVWRPPGTHLLQPLLSKHCCSPCPPSGGLGLCFFRSFLDVIFPRYALLCAFMFGDMDSSFIRHECSMPESRLDLGHLGTKKQY